MNMKQSLARTIIYAAIISAIVWASCGKKKDKDEATSTAQSTLPTLSLSCGNSSCVH